MQGRHAPLPADSEGRPRPAADVARFSPPTLTRRHVLGLMLASVAAAWLAPLGASAGEVAHTPRRDVGVWADGWLLDSGDL